MRYSLVWFIKPKKFTSKKLQFIIIGKELTKKRRVHYQGYAEIVRKLSFKQLKRLFGRTCHIEVAKKSAIHNIAYCCKEGSIYHVFGSPCEQRAAHLLAHFSNSQKVKDAQNTKNASRSQEPQAEAPQDDAQSLCENKSEVEELSTKTIVLVNSVSHQEHSEGSNDLKDCRNQSRP